MKTPKTWQILTVIGIFSGFFVFMTVSKIFDHTASIRVLNFPEQGVCYLVTPEYQIQPKENGFNYLAGKNIGEVTFFKGEIGADFNQRKIGEFDAGYKKEKNYRMVQYKTRDGWIVFEKFQFIKKDPPNLSPLMAGCDHLLELHGPWVESEH